MARQTEVPLVKLLKITFIKLSSFWDFCVGLLTHFLACVEICCLKKVGFFWMLDFKPVSSAFSAVQ